MRVMLEEHRVAEVVQKQEGPSAKNLDLRTFWKSLGQKQCFLGKKFITWYILHILMS